MYKRGDQKGRRVFIIGAGMSAECGAPLTREFLKQLFTKHAKGKKLDLVFEFISSVYAKKTAPNIEKVWTRIDDAIVRGESLAGYDHRKLRELRNALFDVLTRILSSVHHRTKETLEWCDVNLNFGPPRRHEVDSLKAFLENPIKWIESSLNQLPSGYKSIAKFFDLLVKHDNAQGLTGALTTFLSQPYHHPLEYARNCATRLTNVLFSPIKFHPMGVRKLFLYRLQGLRDEKICGSEWLGSAWDSSGMKCEEILWRLYLLRNHEERLSELKGWLDTYYLLIQMLQKGDTVITTNYDLFLEMALLSWAGRAKKYGVLWGTDLTEIRDDFHSQYVPGTAVNYAKWEIKAEGYTEGAYGKMIDAEKEGAGEELNSYRKLHEKYLKKWQRKKHEGNWVSVLNLHGSLDWGICRTCKELFTMRLIPFYQAKATILKHRQYSEAHKTHRLCCHNPILEPLMVPPTWRKDYDNKVLVSIWSAAEERLRHADSIVFLGYSLPKLDEKIRDLFKKSLYNRAGKPWDEIVVVNRNVEKVLPAYKRVFGNVMPVQWKISNYLRQITEQQTQR